MLVCILSKSSLSQCSKTVGYSMLTASMLPTEAQCKLICAPTACGTMTKKIMALNPPDCNLTVSCTRMPTASQPQARRRKDVPGYKLAFALSLGRFVRLHKYLNQVNMSFIALRFSAVSFLKQLRRHYAPLKHCSVDSISIPMLLNQQCRSLSTLEQQER
ncbi:hypothetical protein PC128_g25098 [Phytophthora cactorum]|uniref:Elicitin n=1 Tax=Phytophthora cactorum TaxID=29920 RepID=A0A8T1DM25_9STRA|nr:hypothetical protein PC117_g9869 [Phytophthora cactorum]KAG3140879.1 hypothetical protein PC128_g25098 [Phytophthora cactorum]